MSTKNTKASSLHEFKSAIAQELGVSVTALSPDANRKIEAVYYNGGGKITARITRKKAGSWLPESFTPPNKSSEKSPENLSDLENLKDKLEKAKRYYDSVKSPALGYPQHVAVDAKKILDFLSAQKYYEELKALYSSGGCPQFAVEAAKKAVDSKMLENIPKQLNLRASLSDEAKDFASKVFNAALLLERKIGVPAEIVVAQACGESGWGEKVPIDRFTGQYSYNIFGIQGTGTAGSVNCLTKEEFIKGQKVDVYADFAAFNSFEECLAGYDDFLTNKSLYPYDDLFGNMDVNAWAYGLESHHYATASDYAEFLLNIIDKWLFIK